MSIISVTGAEGVGKSTFCYSFSKFLEKRGFSTAIANFDAGCKHIIYKPALDVRSYMPLRALLKQASGSFEKALENVYFKCVQHKQLRKHLQSLAADIVFLDLRGGLDLFLLGSGNAFLRAFADEILYLCDARSLQKASALNSLGSTAALLEQATGLPALAIANKEDLATRSKKSMQPMLEQASQAAHHKIFSISAVERSGYNELLAELSELIQSF